MKDRRAWIVIFVISSLLVFTVIELFIERVSNDTKPQGVVGTEYPSRADVPDDKEPTSVPEMKVQPLRDALGVWRAIPAMLISAVLSWVIAKLMDKVLSPKEKQSLSSSAKEIESTLRNIAREAAIESQDSLRRTAVESAQIARAWAVETRLLRTQLSESAFFRNAAIIAVLTTLMHPVSAIAEPFTGRFFQAVGADALIPYAFSISLGLLAAIICTYRVYRLKRKTHFSAWATVIKTCFIPVFMVGAVWFLASPPATLMAQTPVGWNVPFGSKSLTFLVFQAVVKLGFVPLLAVVGGFIGFGLGSGSFENRDVESVIAVAGEIEAKYGNALQPSLRPVVRNRTTTTRTNR